MKKGFTKAEIKQLEAHIESIDSAIDTLLEFLKEKHQKAEAWIEDRSEAWFDSDNGQEFEEWAEELEFKINDIETIKTEIDIESFEDLLQ